MIRPLAHAVFQDLLVDQSYLLRPHPVVVLRSPSKIFCVLLRKRIFRSRSHAPCLSGLAAAFPSIGPSGGTRGRNLGWWRFWGRVIAPPSHHLPLSLGFRSLFPGVHQRESAPRGGCFACRKGSCRTRSPIFRLLQPSFCSLEGNGLVETSDRPFTSESLCLTNATIDGDQPVGPLCGGATA